MHVVLLCCLCASSCFRLGSAARRLLLARLASLGRPSAARLLLALRLLALRLALLLGCFLLELAVAVRFAPCPLPQIAFPPRQLASLWLLLRLLRFSAASASSFVFFRISPSNGSSRSIGSISSSDGAGRFVLGLGGAGVGSRGGGVGSFWSRFFWFRCRVGAESSGEPKTSLEPSKIARARARRLVPCFRAFDYLLWFFWASRFSAGLKGSPVKASAREEGHVATEGSLPLANDWLPVESRRRYRRRWLAALE